MKYGLTKAALSDSLKNRSKLCTNLRCKNMNNKPAAAAPPMTVINSCFFLGFNFGISTLPPSVSKECTLSSSSFTSYITKLQDRFNLHTEMS